MSDTSAFSRLHGECLLGDNPTPDLVEGQFLSAKVMLLLAEHASVMQQKSSIQLRTLERSLPGVSCTESAHERARCGAVCVFIQLGEFHKHRWS